MPYNSEEITRKLRKLGSVIDVPATKALYAEKLESQPQEDVEVLPDLAYGEDPRHRLDIYYPAKERGQKQFPVILFVHGGGFVAGDKIQRKNIGLFFARKGFCVVIPNYRLAPAHPWPAGAEDVAATVQWTQEHIKEIGGNVDRLIVVGESAGAAHVAAATLISRFHSKKSFKISGAVFISGLYDVVLDNLAKKQFGLLGNDPSNEAYFGKNREDWATKSTIDLADALPFPLLISYAELDPIQMQIQAGMLFSRLVRDHGFSPDIVAIRGHSHLSQIYSINTGDTTLTDEIERFINGL